VSAITTIAAALAGCALGHVAARWTIHRKAIRARQLPTITRTDVLCNDLKAYCERHNLPWLSADELLHELVCEFPQRRDHIEYLKTFLVRWDIAEEADRIDYERNNRNT